MRVFKKILLSTLMRSLLTGLLMSLLISPGALAASHSVKPTTPPDPVVLQEEALQTFREGVELFQVAQSQAEKGNVNGQKRLLRQSIKTFEKALSLDPKLVEAQSNIGFAYLTLEEYARATKEFDKALLIQPTHLNSLNGLATTYTLAGKSEEALKTLNTLVQLEPGNPQYFFNQGSVLQKLGRFEEAETSYREALRLDPQDQRSLFNMGTLYENLGNLMEAKHFYQEAKSVAVSNPIGLESIRRLENIERLQPKNGTDGQQEGTPLPNSKEG